MTTQKAPITLETYHQLKSYHRQSTNHDRLYNLPHICESNYWGNSPHKGYRCDDCNEVEKIIRMKDYLEKKHKCRQYTLTGCTCHWCRNRRQISHKGCRICDEDVVNNITISLSDEDEDEIEDLRQLDEKKIDLGYYYYNEDVDAYLPCSSWEDVPLQDDEVFPHHHQHLLHLLHPLQQENTEWPASPPEISSSDPINVDRIGNWIRKQSENGRNNGYETI